MDALELDDQAGPALPGRWRRPLGDWVEAAGGGPDLVEHVVLAVVEALSNAVGHAFHDGPPGPVRLRARRIPSRASTEITDVPPRATLVVVVADRGRWRPTPESGHRGRGLAIIRALAESVEFSPSTEGTTVRMTWTLDDPA